MTPNEKAPAILGEGEGETDTLASVQLPCNDSTEDTTRFFSLLYPHGDLPGSLSLWTPGNKQTHWHSPRNLSAAAAQAQALSLAGEQVFYGVALHDRKRVKSGSRGTAATTTGIPGFWIDIDLAGPNHKGQDYPPDEDAARELLAAFPLKPSITVATGGGWHTYWLFNEFWRFDSDDERKEAADLSACFHGTMMQHAAAKGWVLDNTRDLARILRPPGTLNRKNGAVPVRVLETTEHRYDPRDFSPYLMDHAQGNGKAAAAPVYSLEGTIPEGRRDNALFKIGAKMRGRGCNEKRILAELQRVNKEDVKPPLPDEDVQRIAHSAGSRYEPDPPEGVDPETGEITESGKKPAPSQATRLWQIVKGLHAVELFHTPDNEAFITFPCTGNGAPHRETWRLKSEATRLWLRRLYGEQFNTVLSSKGVEDTISQLQSGALFDGPETPVHIRSGRYDGAIYVDLGGPDWKAVKITAEGWEVVTDAPIKFRRTRGTQALPEPVRGGRLAELREMVNVRDDDAWYLLAAWITMALCPDGPYPVLCLSGGEGTGKSTVARISRSLIDPNKALLRSEPKDAHDLAVAAENACVLTFDNLSRLPDWLSDGLCRLSTGGGSATRELYSNRDEFILEAQRPVMLTGINVPITRADLISRTILIPLSPIPEHERRSEADLLTAAAAARPRLIGAIFDAMATAMKNLPAVHSKRLPRMADFARWAIAGETAYAPAGSFLKAYDTNQERASDLALETNDVAMTLLDFIKEQEGNRWEGSATALLSALTEAAGDRMAKTKAWPKSPHGLSSHLTRSETTLKSHGVTIDARTLRGKNHRTITWTEPENSGGQGLFPCPPHAPSCPPHAPFAHHVPTTQNETDCAGTNRKKPNVVGMVGKMPLITSCYPEGKRERECDIKGGEGQQEEIRGILPTMPTTFEAEDRERGEV